MFLYSKASSLASVSNLPLFQAPALSSVPDHISVWNKNDAHSILFPLDVLSVSALSSESSAFHNQSLFSHVISTREEQETTSWQGDDFVGAALYSFSSPMIPSVVSDSFVSFEITKPLYIEFETLNSSEAFKPSIMQRAYSSFESATALLGDYKQQAAQGIQELKSELIGDVNGATESPYLDIMSQEVQKIRQVSLLDLPEALKKGALAGFAQSLNHYIKTEDGDCPEFMESVRSMGAMELMAGVLNFTAVFVAAGFMTSHFWTAWAGCGAEKIVFPLFSSIKASRVYANSHVARKFMGAVAFTVPVLTLDLLAHDLPDATLTQWGLDLGAEVYLVKPVSFFTALACAVLAQHMVSLLVFHGGHRIKESLKGNQGLMSWVESFE